MKCKVTFKPETPAGYGGTHWFNSKREKNLFLIRAAERIGQLARWMM